MALVLLVVNLFVNHYKLVSIDAMIPIGRQRELIIGDRKQVKLQLQ
jgi:F0F1-type ATP synthase alpha subunit